MAAVFDTMSVHTGDINRNHEHDHGTAHEAVSIPVLHKRDCCHQPDIFGLRAQIIDNFTLLNGGIKYHSEKSEWHGGKVNPIQIVTLGETPNIKAAVFFGTSTLEACGEPASTTAGALQDLLSYTERKIAREYAVTMLRKDAKIDLPTPPSSTTQGGVKAYAKVSSEMHMPRTVTSKSMHAEENEFKGMSINDLMALGGRGRVSGVVPVGGVKMKNDETESTATTAIESSSSFATQPHVLPSTFERRRFLPPSPRPIPTTFQTDFDRRPIEYANPPNTPEPKTPVKAMKKHIPGLTPEQHDRLWSPNSVNNPNFSSSFSDEDDDDSGFLSQINYDTNGNFRYF